MHANHGQSDAFLVSFPKCGRTWHRALVGHYLSRLTGSDPRTALDVTSLCQSAGLRQLSYTHNGSAPAYRLPSTHELVASPQEWKGKDVVLLVRDPRDVMVSLYFHTSRRDKLFDGTISEFIRTPSLGVPKLATAWTRWHQNRKLAASFRVISYEEMHRDPHAILRMALALVGAPIREDLIEESVQFASFNNMRLLERSGYFRSRTLGLPVEDMLAAKIRAGKVRNYPSELSPEDIAYIEGTIVSIGDPFKALSGKEDRLARMSA